MIVNTPHFVCRDENCFYFLLLFRLIYIESIDEGGHHLGGFCKYYSRPKCDLCYYWHCYTVLHNNGFIRDFSEEGGEEIFLPALSSANKLHSLTNQKLPEISPHCEGTGK